MALVYLGRTMHGATTLVVAVLPVWIGVRIPQTDRAEIISTTGAFLIFGIVSGPLLGNLAASITSSAIFAAASPGFLVIGLSSLNIAVIYHLFDDFERLEQPPSNSKGSDASAVAEESATAKRLFVFCSIVMFLTALGGLSSESMLPVIVFRIFEWDAVGSWRAFVPWMIGGVAGAVGVAQAAKAKVSAWNQTLTCLAVLTGSVVAYLFEDPDNPYPSWHIVLGYGLLSAGTNLYTVTQAVLAERLPPSFAIKYSAAAQAIAATGRSLGPVFGTQLIENLGISAPAAVLMMSATVLIGGLIPVIFAFRDVYGTPRQPMM